MTVPWGAHGADTPKKEWSGSDGTATVVEREKGNRPRDFGRTFKRQNNMSKNAYTLDNINLAYYTTYESTDAHSTAHRRSLDEQPRATRVSTQNNRLTVDARVWVASSRDR